MSMNNLKKKLDELVKQSDLFISTPETIDRMSNNFCPINGSEIIN